MTDDKKLTDFLSSDETEVLTENAKTLTKQDLINLRIFANSPSETGKSEQDIVNDYAKESGIKLNIDDIHSVDEATNKYMTRVATLPAEGGPGCCCCTCTPCCSCSAAAVIDK